MILNPAPLDEHIWLQSLVGKWTFETGSGDNRQTGTEVIRPLGELWIIAESSGIVCQGKPANSVTTLGYDPEKQSFQGTWVGSMMNHMWIYEGKLDSARRRLTLNSTGPGMEDPSKPGKYRDIIEVTPEGSRLLISEALGSDGRWTEFSRVAYQRVE